MNSTKFKRKLVSLSKKLAGIFLASCLFIAPVFAVDYERFVMRNAPCDPWEYYFYQRWIYNHATLGSSNHYAFGMYYESQFAGTSSQATNYIPGNLAYRMPKGFTFTIYYDVPAGETFYFKLYDMSSYAYTVTTSNTATIRTDTRQTKVVIKKGSTQIYSAGSTSSTDELIHNFSHKNTSSSSASYSITFTSASGYYGFIVPVLIGYDSLLSASASAISSGGGGASGGVVIDYSTELNTIILNQEEANEMISVQYELLSSIDIKLTSINDTLEDLYEFLVASGSGGSGDSSIVDDMNETSSGLADNIGTFEDIESGVVDDFSTNFDSIDLDLDSVGLTTQALSGAYWLRDQIDYIYSESGGFKVLFAIPLILGLAAIFIGRAGKIFGGNDK